MGIQLLTVQPFPLVFEDQHGAKLVRADLVEGDSDAQFQRAPEVERAPDEQTGLRGLRGVELVQGAVIASATVIGGVRTQPRIAEFLAPERPMNKKPDGGFFWPLPVQKFGSRSSWKPASSASMAALTATA